jgi:ATP-dependent Clp protease ATP-binding subunit ClpA
VALKAVKGELTSKLREVSGSMRTALAAPVIAELDRVQLKLKRSKRPLRIAIALVVTMQETSSGPLYIVRAPEVPDFALVVDDRDGVRVAARYALKQRLSHWGIAAVLASEDLGTSRLETVTLPFPSPGEPQLTRSEDGFTLEDFGDELTARAKEGRLGQLDRRDALVERVLVALASPGRSSVMLVGPGTWARRRWCTTSRGDSPAKPFRRFCAAGRCGGSLPTS